MKGGLLAAAALFAAAFASHTSVANAGAQNPCAGEFSLCNSTSVCALVFEQCSQCAAGQYACPLSSTCVDTPADVSSCPGLAGTHFDTSLTIEERLDALFAMNLTLAEMITQLTDNATEIARVGIPAYDWLNDDQHGVKQPDATAFPNGVSLGAAWDADSLLAVGLAIGVEARGVHNSLLNKTAETGGEGWPGQLRNGAGLTGYTPNLNLAIHAGIWGRAQEVMSECPYLTSTLVASYVSGMQNTSGADFVNSGRPILFAACCKHFAAYNLESIPTDRTLYDANVNARDLWETFLPAFEACTTRAKSQSVMCSYNAINGVPTCGSPGLLTEALRGHMGFDGFVVSDYDAWANIVSTHKYVSTWGEAATVGLNAGLDQEGGGGPTYPPVQTGIPAAVAVGNVTLAQVQLAMRRLFRVRLRLGMFDPPLQNPYDAINHTQVASPAHLALAEDAARKGMTLLKNSVPAGGPASGAPALPLSPAALVGKKVAVVGPLWNVSKQLLGSYSDPSCCLAGIPAFFDELVARLPGAHVSAAAGCGDANCDGKTAPVNFTEATALVSDASAVIAVMGMGQSQFACGGDSDRAACESEGYDRLTCALPGQQSAFLQAVRAAAPAGVPVVVVFVHGTSFCLEPGFLAAADAILDAWYPGMRGAPAMADAIVGAFSPSGRSPVTWYSSDAALPSNRSDASPYASASSPGWTYRYYTPEVVQADPPVFTFGEGLSYSTFAVESVAAPTSAGPCDAINVSVTVRNTGAVDSDVVVALYASQAASVPSPIARLVGFARVFVAAGQTATAALSTVTPESRAVVHDDGAGDIYSYAGKRWNEAGTVNFRVSLGAHNGHVEGGTVFTVQQTGTQDLSTC